MSAAPAALRMPVTARRSFKPLAVGAGVLALAAVLAYVGSNVYASLGQRDLSHRMDAALADWAELDSLGRSSVVFAQGDPVARMLIPEIGLEVVVAEGATPSVMRRGPGHLSGSATPGEEGVAIVTANRFGFGSYFSRIDTLAEGDRIVTESVLGRTTYTVTEVRTVPADRLDLSTDSTRRVLLLFGSARRWGGSDRIVVRAVAEGAPRL